MFSSPVPFCLIFYFVPNILSRYYIYLLYIIDTEVSITNKGKLGSSFPNVLI